MNAISYRNLHFPPLIVQHAVWLHARFNLSLPDIKGLTAERCVEVSYGTIRRWIKRLGLQIARRLRSERSWEVIGKWRLPTDTRLFRSAPKIDEGESRPLLENANTLGFIDKDLD